MLKIVKFFLLWKTCNFDIFKKKSRGLGIIATLYHAAMRIVL
jgi:hypothetical protein